MIAALAGLGWAQDAPLAAGADLYRPAVESAQFLGVDDASAGSEFTARADVAWGHELLVFAYDDGEEAAAVQDAVAMHLSGATGSRRLRLSADLPMYVLATGDAVPNRGPRLGDPLLGLRYIGREAEPFGWALLAHLQLPSGASRASLGERTLAADFGGLLDGNIGRARLVGEALMRFGPTADVGDGALNDRVVVRLGAAYRLEDWSIGLEGHGAVTVQDPSRWNCPAEVMLTGGYGRPEGGFVRMGVATGVLPGVGSPTVRLVVAGGTAPKRDL